MRPLAVAADISPPCSRRPAGPGARGRRSVPDERLVVHATLHDGRPQVTVPDEDRRRVYLWMDLNIPYYGTSSSNHKAELGSRRMMPLDLDATLAEVAARRCSSCHQSGAPRKFYTRVLNPERNGFLLAPLAKESGGTQKCSQPVFASAADPDYQKILRTFAPIRALLRQRPRADMPEFAAICEEQVSEP